MSYNSKMQDQIDYNRDKVFDDLTEEFVERYPDPTDRRMGTGPQVHVKGGSARSLAEGYAKLTDPVLGPLTWKKALLPEFCELLAEHQLPQLRAAAITLAASLVAMIEDIDGKIERAAERS